MCQQSKTRFTIHISGVLHFTILHYSLYNWDKRESPSILETPLFFIKAVVVAFNIALICSESFPASISPMKTSNFIRSLFFCVIKSTSLACVWMAKSWTRRSVHRVRFALPCRKICSTASGVSHEVFWLITCPWLLVSQYPSRHHWRCLSNGPFPPSAVMKGSVLWSVKETHFYSLTLLFTFDCCCCCRRGIRRGNAGGIWDVRIKYY